MRYLFVVGLCVPLVVAQAANCSGGSPLTIDALGIGEVTLKLEDVDYQPIPGYIGHSRLNAFSIALTGSSELAGKVYNYTVPIASNHTFSPIASNNIKIQTEFEGGECANLCVVSSAGRWGIRCNC